MSKKFYGHLQLQNAQEVRWADTDNSNYVALKSPGTVSSNLSLTLPDSDSADGVLKSNGSGVLSIAKVVNANIDASAAIAYSKLNLSGSIVNADINASAAIAYSKLSLAGSIVNADINASAAIAYSKLNLSGSIVNADISASAAIAFTKLAALSQGSILIGNASNQAEALAIGASGYVLKSDGTTASWQPDAGSSSVAATWAAADGTSKVVTHNLGSKDVIVQLYDMDNDETIDIDTVDRNTVNQVTLTASQAPATNWRVLVMKVG